ncbi:hypothetical protein H8E52_11000, partial [bacterium]|nr:hypothetical protein [bacterium]
TFVEAIERPQFVNGDCRDNEIEIRFMYNWDGKDRGYYFLRAQAHDRSGNTGDYTDLQIFHSDPPGSPETGGILYAIPGPPDCLGVPIEVGASDDGDPLGIKYQFDRRTNLRCDEDGVWWSDPGFIVETEFSPPYDPDVWRLNYFEAGYGYNVPGEPYDPSDRRYGYRCTSNSSTSDGPAFRAVDEDGIYSRIILYDVIIEDVSQPRLEWITPDCEIIDEVEGEITLTVWASDYPCDDRDGLPGIAQTQFYLNDIPLAVDETGIDVGMQEIDGLTGPTFEFSYTFDITDFIEEHYGLDYSGPVTFVAVVTDFSAIASEPIENPCID